VTGDYLWDRTGPPDPEVVALERVLGVLAHRSRPVRPATALAAPRTPRAAWSWRLALAPLATAAIVTALVWVSARFAAPTGPALAVTRLAGTPTIAARPVTGRADWPEGRWLETGGNARAEIDIGTIGRLEVAPDTRLGLLRTRPGDYRLRLAHGTMEALIWAPPGQVALETPTSTAVDLGCAYTMTVDDEGTGLVRVSMGWVGFAWRGRESFIPAGAACLTRPGLGPGTPYYEDTSAAFQAALAALDERVVPQAVRAAALDRVLAGARPRDVVTLWHLLARVDGAERDRVFDRLAAFVPPPDGVTRDAIRAGTRDALDAWWDKLDLGSTSWWRTWTQQWRDNAGGK